MPIWGVFPKVWLDLIPNPTVKCPQIRCISYRQMFQHRSGFNGRDSKDALYKSNNRTVLGYLQDNNGFLEQDYNLRYYANINFVMAGYLLPLYEKPHLAGELMAEAVKRTGLEQRDSYVRQELGERFDQILHERIFNKEPEAESELRC